MKIDFENIPYEDIDGSTKYFNARYDISRAIYLQEKSEDIVMFARRIFNTDGEVELTEIEADVIRKYAERYPLVFANAIKNAIKP